MIGLDTNLLVRYITQDDPVQSPVAEDVIERQCSKDRPCFINHIILCELVWVLRRCYKAKKSEIIKVIEQILKTEEFAVQESDIVWLALNDYKDGGADFADYLIGRINTSKGCESTVTFDRKVLKMNAYKVLS